MPPRTQLPADLVVAISSAIFAGLAAIFAGWSGYEAHKARLDALDATNRTIALQNQTMHVDERPFVNLHYVKLENASPANHSVVLRAISRGKTPALNVKIHSHCGSTIGAVVNAQYEETKASQTAIIFPDEYFDSNCKDTIRSEDSPPFLCKGIRRIL